MEVSKQRNNYLFMKSTLHQLWEDVIFYLVQTQAFAPAGEELRSM